MYSLGICINIKINNSTGKVKMQEKACQHRKDGQQEINESCVLVWLVWLVHVLHD